MCIKKNIIMAKVISINNLPKKLPLQSSILAYLLLEKFNPDGWVWGTVITIFVYLWLVQIAHILTQDSIDVFEDKNVKSSVFGEKLKELSEKM